MVMLAACPCLIADRHGGGALAADGWTQADLIWRHGQTGDVAVWLMDGVSVKQAPLVSLGVASAWQISGVEDGAAVLDVDHRQRCASGVEVPIDHVGGRMVTGLQTAVIGIIVVATGLASAGTASARDGLR